MKRLAVFLAFALPAVELLIHGQGLPLVLPTPGQTYHQSGVMEAGLPGRELRAICWLEAYLSDFPTAIDAEAVRTMIAELTYFDAPPVTHTHPSWPLNVRTACKRGLHVSSRPNCQ